MIKKITMLFLIVVLSNSCKNTSEPEFDIKKVDSTENDTLVGNDKDEHGCLASAGYTWSQLNKECVRVFTGLQLLPVKDATTDDQMLCAYVLFDENKQNAEIFLPDADNSILFKQTTNKQIWTSGTYRLIAKKGFQLEQNGKVLFAGDGQIGSKVLGNSDTEESDVPETE